MKKYNFLIIVKPNICIVNIINYEWFAVKKISLYIAVYWQRLAQPDFTGIQISSSDAGGFVQVLRSIKYIFLPNTFPAKKLQRCKCLYNRCF